MDSSLSARIADAIDHADPAPLYHQVAAVVRWEILHGRLAIGRLLPPIREVAAAAGVNYHTVRRAWADLEGGGVITQRRGRGARVVRMPQQVAWSPAGPAVTATRPRVWVLADALGGAVALAEHLADRWHVGAVPWPPGGDHPPPGIILALGDAASVAATRWPEREGDLRPLPLATAPQTLAAIRRNVAILGARRILIIGGQNEPAAAELKRQLPRVGLEAVPHREGRPGDALEEHPEAVAAYFPAAWRDLDWTARSHPRAIPIELQWAAGRVAGVAVEQGWEEREKGRTREGEKDG